MALAEFFVTVLAPILGATADAGGRRKQFLAIMTGTGVLATLLLSLTGAGDIWLLLNSCSGTDWLCRCECFL